MKLTLFAIFLAVVTGCGSRDVTSIIVIDSSIKGDQVGMIVRVTTGVDKTPFYSNTRQIDWRRGRVGVYEGVLSRDGTLTNTLRLAEFPKMNRDDLYFFAPEPGMYIHVGLDEKKHSNFVEVVNSDAKTVYGRRYWTEYNSVLPSGFCLNRSKAKIAITREQIVYTASTMSNDAFEATSFSPLNGVEGIDTKKMGTETFFTDDGESLIIQGQSRRHEVHILAKNGRFNTISIPDDADMLLDADVINGEVVLVEKNLRGTRTMVLFPNTGKQFRNNNLDSAMLDVTGRRVLFLGAPVYSEDQPFGAEIWNYETGSRQAVTLSLGREKNKRSSGGRLQTDRESRMD